MDLLLFGGSVFTYNIYSSVIWKYEVQTNEWVELGDLFYNAHEVAALPIQGLSCT